MFGGGGLLPPPKTSRLCNSATLLTNSILCMSHYTKSPHLHMTSSTVSLPRVCCFCAAETSLDR